MSVNRRVNGELSVFGPGASSDRESSQPMRHAPVASSDLTGQGRMRSTRHMCARIGWDPLSKAPISQLAFDRALLR